MFELLPNVHKVPINPDALKVVHRGMNKVRVSVGEHNSEPSEVYIVTGKSDGDLETYIIFFMLEPGIHVVYGCGQNPYAPALEEQILEEATIFVEAMGSILEEVPWGTMTADQRSDWVEKEALYSELVIDGLEEVEEIEDLEIVEVESVEEEAEGVIPVKSAGRGSRPAGEAGTRGRYVKDLTKVPDKDAGEGVSAARPGDVVVGEGDFDEMLKQAFLKPDVVEKTRRKGRIQASMDEEEPLLPEGQDADKAVEFVVEDEMETFGIRGGGETEEDLDVPAGIGDGIDVIHDRNEPNRTRSSGEKGKTLSGSDERALTERDNTLRVIRFLSRF